MKKILFKHRLLVALALFSVLFRIIPHYPNFSPVIVFYFYFGQLISKRWLLMISILSATVVSDLCLAAIWSYPVFGYWSLFTYTAFLGIGLLGRVPFARSQHHPSYFVLIACTSSLLFWIWTNAGVWLLSGFYPHSWHGLMSCYVLAYPFLTSSLLAAIVWSGLLVLTQRMTRLNYQSIRV